MTTTAACNSGSHTNPLLKQFDTPYHTAPFSQITTADYGEAINAGIANANAEIQAIVDNPDEPTFENTIVALDRVGSDLNRALGLFFNLAEADSDDEMMQLSLEVSPKLSAYSTGIVLNQPLWNRVKHVWENRDKETLDTEDMTLLQKTYDSFALSGADLEGDDRQRYSDLNARLSELTTRFGQNVLRELNTYEVYLTADDLAGLPDDLVNEAAADATPHYGEGEYRFTLAAPTYISFLKNSDRRDLREKMYRLYTGRNTQGEFSNLDIMKEIATVRLEIANLLGSPTYADHSLQRTMAHNPAAVYNLLDQLREAYTPALKAEMAQLTAFATEMNGGEPITIQPWDYSYYANKLKNNLYAYDEEELRPYFELNNTINGVFGLATRLYGVQFKQRDDIEVYHPDVTAWEVTDRDGEYLGVLYTDFFPRDSKRPGAWMTNFTDQYINADGEDQRPHVSIVMNFTKPTADKPSLLTPYEVETFLHEFGHSLHGLLTKCKYQSLSGTSVYRDFVELPSQFNENYLTEREFLDSFARHYKTGEPIPGELVDKIIKTAQFGAAYQCLRQLSFGYLDMAYHTLGKDDIEAGVLNDPAAFENNATLSVRIFEPVEGAMTAPQFSHIFSGGYAAGYYSYKWAEVLDADAFAHFKENGIFDQETAQSFRDNVLSRGGSDDPAKLYRQFRGADPSIDALLERDGIK
ncbi:MAG: M3 family metallopeptidase [Muribaculaceae bacterium]|nr:M3 family metallopeptidase [Muribaculaceae bacterium]